MAVFEDFGHRHFIRKFQIAFHQHAQCDAVCFDAIGFISLARYIAVASPSTLAVFCYATSRSIPSIFARV